jgi:hypothetical protein
MPMASRAQTQSVEEGEPTEEGGIIVHARAHNHSSYQTDVATLTLSMVFAIVVLLVIDSI